MKAGVTAAVRVTRFAPKERLKTAQRNDTTTPIDMVSTTRIGSPAHIRLRHHVIGDEAGKQRENAEMPYAARAVRLLEADGLHGQARCRVR